MTFRLNFTRLGIVRTATYEAVRYAGPGDRRHNRTALRDRLGYEGDLSVALG